jgi:multisubunit Na+/H+ antiporter MnhB subunit
MDPAHFGSALGNIVTSCALALAGVFAIAMALSPARRSAPLPPLIALAAGVALIALAADEGLELHDRLGRWLWNEHGIAAPEPINHVDDLFVMAYVGSGVAVLAVCLRRMLRHPRFLMMCAVAGALAAGGTAFDAFGSPGTWTEAPEEAAEALGALLLALAFRPYAGARTLVRLPGAVVARDAWRIGRLRPGARRTTAEF